MLIEFKVENFKSIKDEVCLSMLASDRQVKDHGKTHVVYPKLKNNVTAIPLLRSAVLYGQNAGGKTNILQALATMRQMLIQPSHNLSDKLPVTPFKLDTKTVKKPSRFTVMMLIDGIRYQYGFAADAERIHEEWLLAFPRGKEQLWFKRKRPTKHAKDDLYKFGSAFKGQKKTWQAATRPKRIIFVESRGNE